MARIIVTKYYLETTNVHQCRRIQIDKGRLQFLLSLCGQCIASFSRTNQRAKHLQADESLRVFYWGDAKGSGKIGVTQVARVMPLQSQYNRFLVALFDSDIWIDSCAR